VENRILSGQLGGLQNVGAKVGHRHYGRTGIKYKTLSYKRIKKKKKILVKAENFKVHSLAILCGRNPQYPRDSKCHEMDQNQKTSMQMEWMITGLQKSQKMENRTPPSQLGGLVGAKVEY